MWFPRPPLPLRQTCIWIGMSWLVLSCHSNAMGQYVDVHLDSLTQMLHQADSDSIRAGVAFQLAEYHFSKVDPDSGLALTRAWLSRCRTHRWDALIFQGMSALIANYNSKKLTDSVLYLSERILASPKLITYSSSQLDLIAGFWIKRGKAYLYLGNYAEATAQTFKGLARAEAVQDTHSMILALNNLGVIHGDMWDFEEERRYYHQAYRMAQSYRHPGFSLQRFEESYFFNIGAVYLGEKAWDSALYAYRRSVSLFKRRGATLPLAMAYLNLGRAIGNVGQMDSATYYLQFALQMAQDLGQTNFKFTAFYLLAKITATQQQWETAQRYLDSCQAIASSQQRLNFWESYYEASGFVHKSQGNYKRALDDRKRYLVWKDSVRGQEQIDAVNQWKSRYQTEKKEHEILALSEKTLQQELDLERRDRLIIQLVIALFFTVLSVGMGYVVLQQRQRLRAQQAIYQAVAKTELAEQNRIAQDLHDSMGALLGTIAQRVTPATQASDIERQTYQLVKKAGEEMRRISHNLMPTELLKFGLFAAIEGLVSHVSTPQLKTSFYAFGVLEGLSTLKQLQVFRITQELVQNAVKHAEASELSVQLTRHDAYLNLIVADNGKGFDQSSLQEGLGFQSLRNRVTLL